MYIKKGSPGKLYIWLDVDVNFQISGTKRLEIIYVLHVKLSSVVDFWHGRKCG